MNTLERFMAYAGDFETSYEDDDWERIKPHFADDAVYEVDSREFGSRMEGAEAIVAGLKKSLDGFDRKFDTRAIEVVDGPTVDGDEIRVAWKVTYTGAGCEPYYLVGRSEVRINDDGIVFLADRYDAAADQALVDWKSKNDLEIDPSYT